MTDKQEMIIDSVDVSGCSALCCGNTCFLSRHYSFTEPKHKQWCSDNPNCHFKQLQRKTAECEELKNTLNKLTRGVVIPMQEPEVINLANHYHKALDEIKEIAAKNRNEFHFNNLIETVQTLNDFIKDFKQILYIISKAKGDSIENT